MCKSMRDMVKGAVGEMRRFYSRKVIDVLVKVTRQSLDAIRKRFTPSECEEEGFPVFIINASLLLPKVAIKPTLEDVQDVLVITGKNITAVAKGVGQWTCGKPPVIFCKQVVLFGLDLRCRLVIIEEFGKAAQYLFS